MPRLTSRFLYTASRFLEGNRGVHQKAVKHDQVLELLLSAFRQLVLLHPSAKTISITFEMFASKMGTTSETTRSVVVFIAILVHKDSDKNREKQLVLLKSAFMYNLFTILKK